VLFNFCLTGIYQLLKFRNLRGYCLFYNCELSDLSSEFKDQSLSGILALANVVALIVAKYSFTYFVNKTYTYEDSNRITPSDYTLLMKLPENLTQNSSESLDILVGRIINSQKKILRGGIVEIVKVNPVFNIRYYLYVTRQILRLEKIIAIKKNKKNSATKEEDRKNELKKEFAKIKEGLKKDPFANFTGWVLVTFQTEKDVQTVLRRSSASLTRFRLSNKYKVHPAPEPNDLIWENFGIPLKEKIFKRLITFVVTFVIIGISFGIIIVLKYAQVKIDEKLTELNKNSLSANIFIAIAISFFISVINYILHQLLVIFTRYETYKTYSNHFAEIVFKITIAKFVNTAIIILIATRVVNKNNDWNVFNQAGIIGNIFVIMVISVFSETVYWLLDPMYMLRAIRRKLIKTRLSSSLQCEVNEAYEGYNFNISEIYFTVFKVLSLAFFYQFFLPYGLLLAAIELALIYVVSKYVLVSRSCKPQDMDFLFTRKMIKNFELMIFILSLGYLVFDMIAQMNNPSISKWSLIAIIIGGVEWLIGINAFATCFKKPSSYTQEHTYRKFKLLFPYDYDRLNPMTQREAFQEFFKEIQNTETPGHGSKKDFDIDSNNALRGLNDYLLFNQRIINPEDRIYVTDDIRRDQGLNDVYDMPLTDVPNVNYYDFQAQNDAFIKVNQYDSSRPHGTDIPIHYPDQRDNQGFGPTQQPRTFIDPLMLSNLHASRVNNSDIDFRSNNYPELQPPNVQNYYSPHMEYRSGDVKLQPQNNDYQPPRIPIFQQNIPQNNFYPVNPSYNPLADHPLPNNNTPYTARPPQQQRFSNGDIRLNDLAPNQLYPPNPEGQNIRPKKR
jgi:hypothetical protein